MNTEKFDVELKFITDILGAVPKNKEVYASYIKTKAPIPENAGGEVATVTEIEEKGWTGFHQDEKGLLTYDYTVRGFLKEAAAATQKTHGVKNFKSKIDRMVFIFPRRLHFLRNGKEIKSVDGMVERPLRAMTMQGPRVTLARSDMLREGCSVKFQVEIIENKESINEAWVRELFQYGRFQGLGQFRNGSYGRFEIK